METFTLDPRRWRIARIFGRNPLLRRTDRIEALVMLVALVAALVAVPVAGVVGAATYGVHERLYSQQARERHLTQARITQVAEARPEDLGVTVVRATWPAAAGERTGTLRFAEPLTAGEHIAIWVDDDGNPVAPPTPVFHAAGAAVGTAMLTLLIAGVAMTSLLAVVVHQLDRARAAGWERDLRCLVENDGRTNRQ